MSYTGWVQWEGASRPVSRVLSRAIIHLGPPSPTASSSLPGSACGPRIASLLGLASDGVCPAAAVAIRAVRSYRTFSPLPGALPRRYLFCGTFRGLAPPRRYLASCPLKPGLSSRRLDAAGDCLASSQPSRCMCRGQAQVRTCRNRRPLRWLRSAAPAIHTIPVVKERFNRA